MKLKHIFSACALSCLSTSLVAAPLNDARTAARGGTGIAIGDLRSITINPATLATASDAYFSIGMNVGAFATMPEDMLDDIDDVQDELDEFDWRVNDFLQSGSSDTSLVSEPLINSLKALDGQTLTAEVGGTPLVVALPLKSFKGALFTKLSSAVQAQFVYDDRDDNIIDGHVNYRVDNLGSEDPNIDTDFDANKLKSGINAVAAAMAEVGLTYAHSHNVGIGDLDWGASLKYQRLYVFNRFMQVNDFDEDDIFDRDRDSREKNLVNIDVGVVQHFDGSNFSVAAVAENLIPYSTKLAGQTYKISPQVTVGGAYDIGWFKAEANIDLLENHRFNVLDKTQLLRVGAEFGWRHAAQFRLGYIHDLRNNEKDLYTVGFGISPFDVFNIDVAAMVGKDMGKKDAGNKQLQAGVMVGLGLKF